MRLTPHSGSKPDGPPNRHRDYSKRNVLSIKADKPLQALRVFDKHYVLRPFGVTCIPHPHKFSARRGKPVLTVCVSWLRPTTQFRSPALHSGEDFVRACLSFLSVELREQALTASLDTHPPLYIRVHVYRAGCQARGELVFLTSCAIFQHRVRRIAWPLHHPAPGRPVSSPYAAALNGLCPGRAPAYAFLRIPRWVLGTADAGRAVVSSCCSIWTFPSNIPENSLPATRSQAPALLQQP